MENKYNYIDLFSGIGGFALGAYWAGIKFENHFYIVQILFKQIKELI